MHPDPNQKFFSPRTPRRELLQGIMAAAIPLILAGGVASAAVPMRPFPSKKETPKAPPAKDKEQQKDEGKKLFGTPAKDDKSPDPAAGPKGWYIVLESYSGAGHAESAARRVAQVREAVGKDVSVRTSAKGSAIVMGPYPGYESPAAVTDLQRVRELVVQGSRPYALAFLAPGPQAEDIGKLPELSLANARKTFGKQAKFTLQVGVYESKNPDERKRAAEQAAVALRAEGDLAFYYHGPTRSMVTVGLFGDRDFDQFLRPKSAELLTLQQKYPLNLLNGQFPIIEKQPGVPDRQQPSWLVSIPE